MSKGSIVCSDNIEVAWKTCNNVTGKYGKEKFQNAHIGEGGEKGHVSTHQKANKH